MAHSAPSNACAGLSDEEQERLWAAAVTLVNERGLILRIADLLGGWMRKAAQPFEAIAEKVFGENWEEKYEEFVEEVLRRAYDTGTFGLDPDGERDPWLWFNRVAASVIGGASGFAGAPGLLVDVPVTTCLMFRSIAEIARAHGEDISSEEARRACIEVFALGGPGSEDDDADAGYWAARAAIGHTTLEATIKAASKYFGVVLSEQVVVKAVPVVGAAAGGSLNWVFMDHFQQMARVHFTVRAVERFHDPEHVRACFASKVREARRRRERKTAA